MTNSMDANPRPAHARLPPRTPKLQRNDQHASGTHRLRPMVTQRWFWRGCGALLRSNGVGFATVTVQTSKTREAFISSKSGEIKIPPEKALKKLSWPPRTSTREGFVASLPLRYVVEGRHGSRARDARAQRRRAGRAAEHGSEVSPASGTSQLAKDARS